MRDEDREYFCRAKPMDDAMDTSTMRAELTKMENLLDEARNADKPAEAEDSAMPQQTGLGKSLFEMSQKELENLYKALHFKMPKTEEG